MPTYNYKCEHCESIFTAVQKMSDPPLSRCDNCGGTVKRIISGGTGLIFRGSGFYLTDYARNNNRKPQSDVTDNKKSKKKTEGKTNE